MADITAQLEANRAQRRRLDALRDRASGSTKRALAMQIRQLDSQYTSLSSQISSVSHQDEAQFSGYVQAYQDLRNAYQNRPSSEQSLSMAEWGKRHWTMYGQNEKRSLDGPPKPPEAPVSSPPKPPPPAEVTPPPAPVQSEIAPPVTPERAPGVLSPVAEAVGKLGEVAPEGGGEISLEGDMIDTPDPKLAERLGGSLLNQPDPFDVSLTPEEQEAIKTPLRSDPGVQNAARAAMTRSRRRQGRQATILTSNRGLTGTPSTARRPQLMGA